MTAWAMYYKPTNSILHLSDGKLAIFSTKPAAEAFFNAPVYIEGYPQSDYEIAEVRISKANLKRRVFRPEYYPTEDELAFLDAFGDEDLSSFPE